MKTWFLSMDSAGEKWPTHDICYTNVNTGTTYVSTLVDVIINPATWNQINILHHTLVHEEHQNRNLYTVVLWSIILLFINCENKHTLIKSLYHRGMGKHPWLGGPCDLTNCKAKIQFLRNYKKVVVSPHHLLSITIN